MGKREEGSSEKRVRNSVAIYVASRSGSDTTPSGMEVGALWQGIVAHVTSVRSDGRMDGISEARHPRDDCLLPKFQYGCIRLRLDSKSAVVSSVSTNLLTTRGTDATIIPRSTQVTTGMIGIKFGLLLASSRIPASVLSPIPYGSFAPGPPQSPARLLIPGPPGDDSARTHRPAG